MSSRLIIHHLPRQRGWRPFSPRGLAYMASIAAAGPEHVLACLASMRERIPRPVPWWRRVWRALLSD